MAVRIYFISLALITVPLCFQPTPFVQSFNMHLFGLVILCTLALSAMATHPLTLTLGSTAYVMTAGQVTIAAASIAALALTKELLILADLGKFRGKRDLNSISQTPVEFGAYFDIIAKSDVDDCGKLLVCHSMAKSFHELTSEEKAITKLFDNLEVINPASGYAEYQLAAYAGTFKHPELCLQRYSKCKVSTKSLGNLIKSQ